MVKSEIAKFAADDRLETQAAAPRPNKMRGCLSRQGIHLQRSATHQQRGLVAKDHIQVVQTGTPKFPKRAQPEHVAKELPKQQYGKLTAFLDNLSSSVNSANCSSSGD